MGTSISKIRVDNMPKNAKTLRTLEVEERLNILERVVHGQLEKERIKMVASGRNDQNIQTGMVVDVFQQVNIILKDSDDNISPDSVRSTFFSEVNLEEVELLLMHSVSAIAGKTSEGEHTIHDMLILQANTILLRCDAYYYRWNFSLDTFESIEGVVGILLLKRIIDRSKSDHGVLEQQLLENERRILDWKRETKPLDIPYNLLNTLEDLIRKRESISRWLQELINTVEKQEVAVNSVKTAGAVGGILGTILLFTLPPVGAAALAASSLSAVATNIGDMIANKVRESSLKDEVSSDKYLTEKLSQELKQADQVIERLIDQYQLTKDQATAAVFASIKGRGQCVINGVVVFQNIDRIREVVCHTTALADLTKIGTVVNQTAVALTAARVATRTMGMVGFDFGIADVVLSWTTDNPTKASAKNAKETIDKSISQLRSLKYTIESM